MARRFDGRVAVITGAGRGLGREYALLLGALGAKVVVNDNGSAMDGAGADSSVAELVAAEIRGAGGEAVACSASVVTGTGAGEIVGAALDTWGRVDAMIHSAGNTRFDDFEAITFDEFRSVVDVHLMGAFHLTKAAFPHMKKAGYGRFVLTGSIGGVYTMPQTLPYAVAKSGMIGLNNILALEGADFGIKSNIILPGAVTRMAEGIDTTQFPRMTPDMVAPVVGYLAHEDCAISAELLASMAGRVARVFFTESAGLYDPAWTIDSIAENIEGIRDPAGGPTFHTMEGGFFGHMEAGFNMARKG